jgi:hypothetical protein
MASSHLSSFRRSVRRRGLRLTRRCTPICESRETIRRTGASHLRSGVLGRKPIAHSRSAPGMSSRRMSGTWGSRDRQAWALSSVRRRAHSAADVAQSKLTGRDPAVFEIRHQDHAVPGTSLNGDNATVIPLAARSASRPPSPLWRNKDETTSPEAIEMNNFACRKTYRKQRAKGQ